MASLPAGEESFSNVGVTRGQLFAHCAEEIPVGFCPLHFIEEEFHAVERRHGREYLAQDPDPVQDVFGKEKFFTARAGTVDIHGGEDAFFGKVTIEINLHVARALEFFEDDLIHAGSRVCQCRGYDGEAAAFLHVTCGAEEALGALQGVGIEAAGEYASRLGRDTVVSPADPGDGIEENDDIAFAFHKTFCFFKHHLADLHVALRRFVKRGADDLGSFYRALHICHFFRTFINEQNDEIAFRTVRRDGVGKRLKKNRFAGSRRRDNEPALTAAYGSKKVDDPVGVILGAVFHDELAHGVNGRQVVEEHEVACLVWILEADAGHFQQGEIAFALSRRTDLPRNNVSLAQGKFAYLRGRNIDVIRTRQIGAEGRAEKTEAVRKDFQHAVPVDSAILGCAGLQNSKAEFLLAQGTGVFNAVFFGQVHQIGH